MLLSCRKIRSRAKKKEADDESKTHIMSPNNFLLHKSELFSTVWVFMQNAIIFSSEIAFFFGWSGCCWWRDIRYKFYFKRYTIQEKNVVNQSNLCVWWTKIIVIGFSCDLCAGFFFTDHINWTSQVRNIMYYFTSQEKPLEKSNPLTIVQYHMFKISKIKRHQIPSPCFSSTALSSSTITKYLLHSKISTFHHHHALLCFSLYAQCIVIGINITVIALYFWRDHDHHHHHTVLSGTTHSVSLWPGLIVMAMLMIMVYGDGCIQWWQKW